MCVVYSIIYPIIYNFTIFNFIYICINNTKNLKMYLHVKEVLQRQN